MADQFRVFRCYEPVDPRAGKTAAQFRQQRNGVYHVAQRRWLDQQDSAKIFRAERFGFQADTIGITEKTGTINMVIYEILTVRIIFLWSPRNDAAPAPGA